MTVTKEETVKMDAKSCVSFGEAYALLSPLFLYPDEESFLFLKNEIFSPLETYLAEIFKTYPNPAREDVYRLVRALKEKADAMRARGDFQKAYAVSFGHIESDVPLHESEYHGGDIFYKTQMMADVSGFYSAFGFALSEEAKERVDHISTELEFMHALEYKQAYAIENAWDEKAALSEDAKKKFIAEHVGKWFGALRDRLMKKDENGFYTLLLQLAAQVVEREACELGVELSPLLHVMTPASEALENNCMSCMGNDEESGF